MDVLCCVCFEAGRGGDMFLILIFGEVWNYIFVIIFLVKNICWLCSYIFFLFCKITNRSKIAINLQIIKLTTYFDTIVSSSDSSYSLPRQVT